MLRISDAERRNRLAIRHGLAAPFATVAEVADALVGLHSSDPATVFLSLRARMEGITIEDIESALYDRAELWRIWSMRRTMFMVPPDLASIMYAAATRDVVADERRKLLKMFRANN
ncbi:MAG: winged helix DNA-binding domain-containing protein, partial [Acidimicrobiia bacterium]|nr:winged helix DNA-binding domain-containing protein [Acidimicrobiia bacterium]